MKKRICLTLTLAAILCVSMTMNATAIDESASYSKTGENSVMTYAYMNPCDPYNPGGGEDPRDPYNPGGGEDPQDPYNPGGGEDPRDPYNPGGGEDPQDPYNPGGGEDPQDPYNPGGGEDPQDPPYNPGGNEEPEEPEVPLENVSEPDTPVLDSILPQTGQLWWPVWLFGACGLIWIIGGIVSIKRMHIGKNN